MFVQIIEGRTADAAGLRRRMEVWDAELRPGAVGFLGSTGGITADGRAIVFARFESSAAARANSERPEQGDWWAETEKVFDGQVSFTESEDVEEFLGGGSDDAGFVQVMKATGLDRDAVKRIDAVFEQAAPTVRPDLIGAIRIWTGPDSGYDVNYFTSEAEARAGEANDPPAELSELAEEYEALIAGAEYFDLSDPHLS